MERARAFTSALLGGLVALATTPSPTAAAPLPGAEVRQATAVAVATRQAGPEAPTACGLQASVSETATTADCLRCHGSAGQGVQLHTTHPVDVEYERARQRPASSLRPMAEAVRRGAFLPEGRVRCHTCHDARSRWPYKLALPAAAGPGDPRAREVARGAERPVPRLDPTLPAEGRDASSTRLCQLCHTHGD